MSNVKFSKGPMSNIKISKKFNLKCEMLVYETPTRVCALKTYAGFIFPKTINCNDRYWQRRMLWSGVNVQTPWIWCGMNRPRKHLLWAHTVYELYPNCIANLIKHIKISIISFSSPFTLYFPVGTFYMDSGINLCKF